MKLYRSCDLEIDAFVDEAHITLMYPNVPESKFRHVLVNQCSVRASDGIRMHYDYERDGFVIEQASKWQWDVDDEACDPDWQEVAFVESWARDPDQSPEDGAGAPR